MTNMRIIRISPTEKFSGVVTIPGDKSISHRSVILGSLADGIVDVDGFLCSADCIATLRAMQSMGVKIDGAGTPKIKIHGVGLGGLSRPKNVLDLGNSGTGTRLLAGLVSGNSFISEITGDDSLKKRPMGRIVKPLTEMGAVIEGEKCPLRIKGGNLKAIDYVSPISSAQVKSCILIAGLFAEGITSVTEPVKSRDHTERMLQYLEADVKIDRLKVSVNGGSKLKAKPIQVPGDISSALFILAGGLIVPGGKVTVKNVGINPTRYEVLDILKRMGAKIDVRPINADSSEPIADITAEYSRLKGINITKDEVPGIIDELPMLAVLAAAAEGRTEVSGAKELRVKESDRIKCVAENLKKVGADIVEKEDGWIINGGRKFKGSVVTSFGDHRIAMSMIIAGLVSEGEMIVEDTEWIDTSFPGFMDIVRKVSHR